MHDHYWTIVVGIVVAATLALGSAAWWAAGAWVRHLSRAEAVAVVGEAFRAHADVVDEIRKSIENKLDEVAEGQSVVVEKVDRIDRRLVAVETCLNGTLIKWDRKTERRRA